MKIENLERAKRLHGEIKDIDIAIKDATVLADCNSGFLMRQHEDGSGASVDYIYENGFTPTELYKEIAEFAKLKFEEHKVKLLAEIETL